MDTEDLDALAPLMLEDLAAVLAPYGVDPDDPTALIGILGSLAGVLVGRAETLGQHRRSDIHAVLARSFAAGRAAAPACRPGCACEEAA